MINSYISSEVQEIMNNYSHNNSGVNANLLRILLHGKLKNTGKLLIFPVDQGMEHGPLKSFASNPDAFDPLYHINFAIEAGFNAYAAPLGMLQVASKYTGLIPCILKVNGSNLLTGGTDEPESVIYSGIYDALELGCAGIGLTIYPGSGKFNIMVERLKALISKAKKYGLLVVIWSYPRGGKLQKDDETSLDVIAYSAHIASMLGADIVKVKLPTEYIAFDKKETTAALQGEIESLKNRVALIKKSCFNGRRIVVFSGGGSKSTIDLINEINAIKDGDGNGSILGRNVFQRPKNEALLLVNDIIDIYKK